MTPPTLHVGTDPPYPALMALGFHRVAVLHGRGTEEWGVGTSSGSYYCLHDLAVSN